MALSHPCRSPFAPLAAGDAGAIYGMEVRSSPLAKVVVASLNSKSAAAGVVSEKRVRDAEGHVRTVRTLDAHSGAFGDELRYVFGKNVAKARRDNKRVIGRTDAVPAKR